MSEPNVQVLDGSDDANDVDTSELQPLDDATAGRATTVDDPSVVTNIVVAEPPAPPLQLPTDAPTSEGIQALQRLGGHATSVDFIPPGLSPEIDEIRAKHIDLVTRLGACLDEIKRLERQYRTEDRAHDLAVRAALRAGSDPPDDLTTDPGERYAALETASAPLWALIEITSEVVAEVAPALRSAEDVLMGKLAEELAEARDKRREAQRILDEATMEEWMVARTSRWIVETADGVGITACQPRPRRESPPRGWTSEGLDVRRPWWRR